MTGTQGELWDGGSGTQGEPWDGGPGTRGELWDRSPGTRGSTVLARAGVMETGLPRRSRCPGELDPARIHGAEGGGEGADPPPACGPGAPCAPQKEPTPARCPAPPSPAPPRGVPAAEPAPARRDGGDPRPTSLYSPAARSSSNAGARCNGCMAAAAALPRRLFTGSGAAPPPAGLCPSPPRPPAARPRTASRRPAPPPPAAAAAPGAGEAAGRGVRTARRVRRRSGRGRGGARPLICTEFPAAGPRSPPAPGAQRAPAARLQQPPRGKAAGGGGDGS